MVDILQSNKHAVLLIISAHYRRHQSYLRLARDAILLLRTNLEPRMSPLLQPSTKKRQFLKLLLLDQHMMEVSLESNYEGFYYFQKLFEIRL